LFQVTNLVGLSLREGFRIHGAVSKRVADHDPCTCGPGQNKLISLPAAIGELKNLKDLNVSSNRIVSLWMTLPSFRPVTDP
jgi:hypothetical protein